MNPDDYTGFLIANQIEVLIQKTLHFVFGWGGIITLGIILFLLFFIWIADKSVHASLEAQNPKGGK